MIEVPDASEYCSPLYEARSVPFEKLSADDFEKCVFACFVAIQSHQGLRVDGQPAGSGDGGFDVYGVVTDSNRKLCIQCKRQKASFGLPLLAKEVAKVALTTHLEKSDVGVHFFICTGGVTQELRRLLRETDRTEILNEAQSVIRGATEGELHTLRERLVQAGGDAEEVVGSYVQTLDRLVAWDMGEFDAALSPAWDSALKVLERYFRVSTVVREHPRALFDRKAYQDRSGSFAAVVQPQLDEGELPAGLVELSGADPGPQETAPRKKLLTVKSLAALAPGEAALVVAEGGAGKTTLLELVRAEVARESSSSTLAVIITCAEYMSGALDTAVHAQLDVKSGSWRMLPDKILILCDGINEAPPGAVRALFGELKPLLKSNNVSCIFTSREDSRAVRTVLPNVPCASLRLAPLTPGRVRALAQHELAEESEVSAFTNAHRAMATRAAGRFMWTPFAVRVALKRWKDSRQLGSTLGELLDATVSARAERDLEIPSQDSSADLPRASVLAIASAMAFEMLLVDGQATCSFDAMGATLKRAICLCCDVYGTGGLNSSQFTDLLRKHDLVQLTAENFRWNHQLVAGALAAQHLASQWRKHLRALKQPLADDAWVFATRYVPKSDLDEYLSELFHADLMLGAGATAELPVGERGRGLQHIFKALQLGQPEELQVTGFFALARVGTEPALSYLREMARDRRSDNGFHAARALAYSGDRLFLLELGAEVDRCRQMGWMMSGGEISIWESASLADRIAIARERLTLVIPGEAVNESLSLFGYEASQEDIPLLETHLRAAKNLTAWITALRVIKTGDHDRAQYLLEKTLSEESDSASKAAIMTAGHSLGLSVDVDEAFSLLIDLSAKVSEDSSFLLTRSDLIKKVLGELPLTMSIRRVVEAQLPTSTGEKKSNFWQLATHIESPTLALVALDMFSNDLKSVGMAANFFLAHQTLRNEHHDALQVAINRYLTDKANWFTFNSWRVLALAAELEFTPRTAEPLHRMILRLTELRELVEGGTMPAFEKSEEHFVQDFTVDSARFRLREYASYLVTGAVGAAGVLPSDVLVKFLHFELASSTPGNEIINAYHEIDPDLLDDEMELVRDKWAQRAGLEMVCEFGLTDRRLELLRTHLRETYCHPMALGSVKRALEKCWNASTCTMVVETIADFEDWPEDWQQVFWDFIRMVGARVTAADRSLIERHLDLAKTAFARRVLRLWLQATLDSRVGLSRLET
ncbi:MAG: restriction endonuclease [Pseudomonas sp.]|nr:restriction endonuclease [Pseudomonas sp.]